MAQFLSENQTLLFLIALWTIPWKGVALWKAARRDDERWFMIILVVNTLAILDILYIFIWSKRKKSDIRVQVDSF